MKHYQPRQYDYPEFEDSFRALLREAEAAADVSKHALAQRKQPAANGAAVCTRPYTLMSSSLRDPMSWAWRAARPQPCRHRPTELECPTLGPATMPLGWPNDMSRSVDVQLDKRCDKR